MTLIFSDGFETNDLSNWTGTEGTVVTGTTYALVGTYGVHCASVGAYLYKEFTAPTSKIVSFASKVKIVTATGSGKFRILQISQGTTWVCRIIYNNGNYYLTLLNSDGVEQSTQITGIVANTIQELRLDYDWNPGQLYTAKAYIDGTLVGSLTNNGVSSTPYTANRIFVLSFEDVAATTADVYFDAIVVNDNIPAGGTTYNQSVSITISSSFTKQAQVSKSVSMSIVNTLSTLKQSTKTFNITATGILVLSRQANKIITSGVIFTLTSIKDINKLITSNIITQVFNTKVITRTIITSITNSLSLTTNVFRLYSQTINVSISTVLSISSAAVETIVKGIRNIATLLLRQKNTTTIEVRLKDNDEL